MVRRSTILVLLFAPLLCASVPGGVHRDFDLSWTIELNEIPAGTRSAVIWIALPQVLPEQDVPELNVQTAYPWEFVEDPDFGNEMVRVSVEDPPATVSLELTARVIRYPVVAPRAEILSDDERKLCLREEALVSLSPRIRALADSLGGDDRTRYDFVLSLMSYDKTTPGWGHGNSERACDVRKGNCTDFHSLFMSLSRARGVPAVFEMGYRTSVDGERNRVAGYHCWAWFYHDGAWVPVDISEADKAPEMADFFFGNLDSDRITFSRGRDVFLPGMRGASLNYLPCGAYAEIDGVPFDGVVRRLSYSVRHSSDAD